MTAMTEPSLPDRNRPRPPTNKNMPHSQIGIKSLPEVNWLYIKAILWTESGGLDNPAWKQRAMQIGNPGDPGLDVLKKKSEGSSLIMSDTLFNAIRAGRANEPKVNVQAGIAYLYTRMANSEIKSVVDAHDHKLYEYIVVGGDNLSKIAKKVDTTVDELISMNPGAKAMIKPKQKLKYHKAKMQRVIVGWRSFTTQEIAKRYNIGDPDYSAKLDYLIKDVFPKLKRSK